MMKKELKKKLESMCDEIGTAAAAEKIDEMVERVSAEFDRKVSDGQSELDAYRELLADVDKIKEMLESLPETDEEAEAKERKKGAKKMNALLDSIEACMWLLTVVAYFAVSFLFGHWHMTWLIFLSSAIGSVLFDMLRKYNKGVPFEKVMDQEFSGVLWLGIVIAYFLYSFTVGGWAWSYSWLIFILGAVIEVIRDGIRKAKRD
ncbi:MAG: hypothetical protein IJW81_08610 [Clostridia bacterium]|nr:hypothetical protein [Clostridia bacterium]